MQKQKCYIDNATEGNPKRQEKSDCNHVQASMATARKQKKDKGLRFLDNLSNFLRKLKIDLRKKIFKSILNNFGGNIRLAIAGGAAVDPKVLKGLHDFGFFVIQIFCISFIDSNLAR